MRREALWFEWRWETFAWGLSQQDAVAEGSLIRVAAGRAGAILTPRDQKQIVIVQPHVSKAIRGQIMARDAAQGDEPSPQKFRLSTLETLLPSTCAAAVAVGADLYVIGSNQ